MGIPLLDAEFKTGCIAIIKGEGRGPDAITAIRADIDALPVLEGTGVSYASQNEGVMHACGHDGHTACLLGVAKLLNSVRERFSGTVMLIFQPAEEGGNGAKAMIKRGAFDNYKPDEIIALHAFPSVSLGKIGLMPRKALASNDFFTVTVTGRGGHGAFPSKAINPIYAAVSMINAISGIVSNQISTFDNMVISVCTFNAGVASNVIPQEAVFSGTVRCLENENRRVAREAIDRILSGVSAAFGCKYELKYKDSVSALINSNEVNEKIRIAAADSIGEENIVILDEPTMGSEDFSDFIMAAGGNGAMFRLGIGVEGEANPDLHNHLFNFNDAALPTGCAVMCRYILNKHRE